MYLSLMDSAAERGGGWSERKKGRVRRNSNRKKEYSRKREREEGAVDISSGGMIGDRTSGQRKMMKVRKG